VSALPAVTTGGTLVTGLGTAEQDHAVHGRRGTGEREQGARRSVPEAFAEQDDADGGRGNGPSA
jgi:hypothetical protein